MKYSQYKGLLLAIIFALFSISLSAYLLCSAQKWWASINDFPEYYAAIKMIAHGNANIYNSEELAATEQLLFPQLSGRSIGFFIPPFAIPWLLPLSWVPLSYSIGIWGCLLIASILASLLWIKSLFKFSNVEFCWMLALVPLFGPAFEAIRIGQPSPLLLLALVASMGFARQKRPILSGFALSILLIKPQYLLPLAAYLLGAGQFPIVLTLGVITAVFAGLALILFGFQFYSSYFHLLAYTAVHSSAMRPEICPTIRGQLLLLFPHFQSLDNLISLILALLGLILIFCLAKRFQFNLGGIDAAVFVALPIGLVTALHCHVYDLLLLLPTCAIFFKQYWTTLTSKAKWASMLALVAFLLPVYSYMHYYYLLEGGVINPLFWILLIFAVEVCMLVKNSSLPEPVKREE